MPGTKTDHDTMPVPNISRVVPIGLTVVGIAGLSLAIGGQFIFGLEPCVLCLWQRVPYGVIAALGFLAFLVPWFAVRRFAVGLSALVFMVGAMIAFYHVGIEEHWWSSAIPGCGGTEAATFLDQPLTPEALKRALNSPPAKPCDQVQWRAFGLSLAGLNGLVSVTLSVLTMAALTRMRRGDQA